LFGATQKGTKSLGPKREEAITIFIASAGPTNWENAIPKCPPQNNLQSQKKAQSL
jgi:hypothetical protein